MQHLLSNNFKKNIKLAIICSGVGGFLFLIGWATYLWLSLIISLGMGFTIRYSKIAFGHFKPTLKLPWQYFFSVMGAITLWGILPISIRYKMNEVDIQLSSYLSVFLIGIMVVSILTYLYYRTEQAFLLQQALDKAEISRVKQDKVILETQLRLLQSQIEPHFLFNTLANIQALISMEPRQASKMLTALTSLLRQSLTRTRDKASTIGHELRFNKAYLAIQQIRLGDRLQVTFNITDQLQDTMQFPPMLLQPLIENAVVHGIEPLSEGGKVELSISIENNKLKISIYNDSPDTGLDKKHKGHNIGLNNIRSRLEQLYEGKADFTYNDQYEGGVLVVIKVPINFSGASDFSN
jgi:sensor histidine kinase YesM